MISIFPKKRAGLAGHVHISAAKICAYTIKPATYVLCVRGKNSWISSFTDQ